MGKNKKKRKVFFGFFCLVFIFLSFLLVKRFNGQAITTMKQDENIYLVDNITSVDNIHELAKFVETDVKVEEPAKEEKNQNTNNANSNDVKNDPYPYYIKVNYGANVVTIYTKDSNGNYTKPFKAMVCSSGTYTPTSGKYKIQYRWRWLGLVGGVYGQYSTQIVGDILFHSVPYTAKSEDKLEYWEYDKLGTTASAGCIRLQTSDAKWIYDNVPKGTVVL